MRPAIWHRVTLQPASAVDAETGEATDSNFRKTCQDRIGPMPIGSARYTARGSRGSAVGGETRGSETGRCCEAAVNLPGQSQDNFSDG